MNDTRIRTHAALTKLFDAIYEIAINTEAKRDDVDRTVEEAWERACHHARQVAVLAEDGRVNGRRD